MLCCLYRDAQATTYVTGNTTSDQAEQQARRHNDRQAGRLSSDMIHRLKLGLVSLMCTPLPPPLQPMLPLLLLLCAPPPAAANGELLLGQSSDGGDGSSDGDQQPLLRVMHGNVLGGEQRAWCVHVPACMHALTQELQPKNAKPRCVHACACAWVGVGCMQVTGPVCVRCTC